MVKTSKNEWTNVEYLCSIPPLHEQVLESNLTTWNLQIKINLLINTVPKVGSPQFYPLHIWVQNWSTLWTMVFNDIFYGRIFLKYLILASSCSTNTVFELKVMSIYLCQVNNLGCLALKRFLTLQIFRTCSISTLKDGWSIWTLTKIIKFWHLSKIHPNDTGLTRNQ